MRSVMDIECAAGHWRQYDLTIGDGENSRADLYHRLGSLARKLTGDGRSADFFFMHKPPGMRIRFKFHQGTPEHDAELDRELTAWRTGGIIEDSRRIIYEPETRLFGGPVSMNIVHQLFTADSLMWLAYHSAVSPGPVWALSLLMLRPLFEAVGVTDGEDLDVWDRVRWQTGRRLDTGDPAVAAGLRNLARTLRAAWSMPERSPAALSPDLAGHLHEYNTAIGEAGERWNRDYFRSGEALIGPRAALAYVVIFHWNRAHLPLLRQRQITEAMAVHPAELRR
jgi:thiopeptide-type bacteriocin biosynthesis protein